MSVARVKVAEAVVTAFKGRWSPTVRIRFVRTGDEWRLEMEPAPRGYIGGLPNRQAPSISRRNLNGKD